MCESPQLQGDMIVRELRRMRFGTRFLVLLPEPDRTKRRRLLVIAPPGATVDHVRAFFLHGLAPPPQEESAPVTLRSLDDQGHDVREREAIEAARRYAAEREWTVAQICVTAVLRTSEGHFVWLRVKLTNNEDVQHLRYAVDAHGVGTLAPNEGGESETAPTPNGVEAASDAEDAATSIVRWEGT